jgi:hypothetical protein
MRLRLLERRGMWTKGVGLILQMRGSEGDARQTGGTLLINEASGARGGCHGEGPYA